MAGGTSFERDRTYITKMSVPAFPVIKTLDVIEDIGFRLFSSQVSRAINALSLQQAEEALDNRVVVAVTSCTHAALDTVST